MRRDSPTWTAQNATILSGFRVPEIENMLARNMTVNNAYIDNSTMLKLLAVSQNGTTENFTAESALVKECTKNKLHGNTETTNATSFQSAGIS